MVKRPTVLWDAWNIQHIQKHAVTQMEVENAYISDEFLETIRGNRKIIIAKISNGRMLTIVLSFEKQKNPYVVSARAQVKKKGD